MRLITSFKAKFSLKILTLVLLNLDLSDFENIVDPDQKEAI